MKATINQTPIQLRHTLTALMKYHKGNTYDAMEASRMVDKVYGIKLDHHDFIDLLEYLVRSGCAEYNHNQRRIDGFTRYTIL